LRRAPPRLSRLAKLGQQIMSASGGSRHGSAEGFRGVPCSASPAKGRVPMAARSDLEERAISRDSNEPLMSRFLNSPRISRPITDFRKRLGRMAPSQVFADRPSINVNLAQTLASRLGREPALATLHGTGLSSAQASAPAPSRCASTAMRIARCFARRTRRVVGWNGSSRGILGCTPRGAVGRFASPAGPRAERAANFTFEISRLTY
jgi:hypothetical protein